MEFWTGYDKDRNATDKILVRGNESQEGEFHLVVHVCIFNSEGQMLVQQRQSFKDGWPNMWDLTIGGSALAGETSFEAAERELYEEIGYTANLSHERPFFTINFAHGFDDYYLLEDDVDIPSLVLQYEEVQAVKWASKEEITRRIEADEFIPYYKSLIEMIFNMRFKRGSHSK